MAPPRCYNLKQSGASAQGPGKHKRCSSSFPEGIGDCRSPFRTHSSGSSIEGFHFRGSSQGSGGLWRGSISLSTGATNHGVIVRAGSPRCGDDIEFSWQHGESPGRIGRGACLLRQSAGNISRKFGWGPSLHKNYTRGSLPKNSSSRNRRQYGHFVSF